MRRDIEVCWDLASSGLSKSSPAFYPVSIFERVYLLVKRTIRLLTRASSSRTRPVVVLTFVFGLGLVEMRLLNF